MFNKTVDWINKFATWRYQLMSRTIFNYARKLAPRLSQTEAEALEAGEGWWAADLMSGKPDWNRLAAIKFPEISAEEQAFLLGPVEQLCQQLNDWKIVYEDRKISDKVLIFIRKHRFFSMAIPKAYGGLEFSATAQSKIITKIATRSLSVAITVMVPNSLGPGELLLNYGTKPQKDYYLPRLAKGEEIPCFALTSLEAGSDAAHLQDYGVICYEDDKNHNKLGIRLYWKKRYITLAPIATLIGLAVQLYDPDHLLGQEENLGITLCLVPRDHPGVKIGNHHIPAFHVFPNGPTEGENVFIDFDQIIGGRDYIGKGWKMLMECLAAGRGISLPALSLSASQLCYATVGAYAKIRMQFGLSIGQFEGVKLAMGEIAGLNYLMEAIRTVTAGSVDLGKKPALCCAMAKYHLTEMARKIINHAMDIHGGRAIQAGPRNYLLHGFMAMPIAITVEGANILTRNLIIFGQGMTLAHPYVYQELKLLLGENSPENQQKFIKLLGLHIRFSMKNFFRAIYYNYFNFSFYFNVKNNNKNKLIDQLTSLSTRLSLVTDLALLSLGSRLKRLEALSARLGDLLSYLYFSATVLYYTQQHEQTVIEQQHATWALKYLIQNGEIALADFVCNIKTVKRFSVIRLFSWILIGRKKHQRLINDRDTLQLGDWMMQQSEFRARMMADCYNSGRSTDPIQRVEAAFQHCLLIEPLLKRFEQERKTHSQPLLNLENLKDFNNFSENFTKEELAQLKTWFILRNDALQVDDFKY